VVHGNANGSGEGGSKAGGLDFFETEASSLFDFAVVSHSGATHDGSEGFSRSREHFGSLSLSSFKSSLFTSRLVKPCFHKTLPVFSKVDVRNDIIMFHGKDI
jgi:hypothetical protein